ncbi:FixH family protein [Aliiglaciecola litoralis]|uniref:FixH family protein n=2 Tax=Aliiglaciecola litoralis TaxID=582857 RepID=A0ABN1LBY0_9ALTE
MLNLALNTDDSLVIDDYYKEGRGINLELTKVQEAKALNIKTLLKVDGNRISLEFLSGSPKTGEALQLFFYHPTLEKMDFSALLTQDANGMFRTTLDSPISGKWTVTLTPMTHNWKIVQQIQLPRKQAFAFNP